MLCGGVIEEILDGLKRYGFQLMIEEWIGDEVDESLEHGGMVVYGLYVLCYFGVFDEGDGC